MTAAASTGVCVIARLDQAVDSLDKLVATLDSHCHRLPTYGHTRLVRSLGWLALLGLLATTRLVDHSGFVGLFGYHPACWPLWLVCLFGYDLVRATTHRCDTYRNHGDLASMGMLHR